MKRIGGLIDTEGASDASGSLRDNAGRPDFPTPHQQYLDNRSRQIRMACPSRASCLFVDRGLRGWRVDGERLEYKERRRTSATFRQPDRMSLTDEVVADLFPSHDSARCRNSPESIERGGASSIIQQGGWRETGVMSRGWYVGREFERGWESSVSIVIPTVLDKDAHHWDLPQDVLLEQRDIGKVQRDTEANSGAPDTETWPEAVQHSVRPK